MPISPGDNVGSYRIIEPLGQGGMATVFKAYHPALDRYVAIKVLHPSFKEDPSFNARFAREARIVAKLDHPNIVPIFDFAEHEGTPYLVMRFVEGKTLKAVLRDGLLPIPRVLAIIHPVTEALAYAHAQGILHRDIKPSNVMRANDGHIFLADFGLARIAQAGDSTISQDMLIGTPQYISPEQARGEPATERSDLYSLGVLLFEMFTGRVPFSADTPYAIIHDHIYTALPLPTSINPNLSEAIERVLLKTLAKDPSARFASATDLMTALEQAAGIDAAHVATMSPPPTPITQLVTPPPTVPEPVAPVSPPPVKSSPKLVAKPAPEKPAVAPAPKPKRGLNRITCAVLAGIALLLLACGVLMAINPQSPLRQTLKNFPPPGPTVDAASAAKTRVALNPQDAAAHVQLGDEFARAKDFDAAYAEYDRAIKLNPRLAIAYIHA
ncbi:MAG: protein kinase, partial [Chloroflexota bacterium]